MSVNDHMNKTVPTYIQWHRGFSPDFLLGARVVTTVPEGPPGIVGRFILLDRLKKLFHGDVVVKTFRSPYPTEEEMRWDAHVFLDENSVIRDVWLPKERRRPGPDPFGENDETGLGGLHFPEK